MKYSTFIVFNDDKISRNFFQNFKKDNVLLIKDKSSNFFRVIKLIISKRIPITAIFLMFFSELIRKNYKIKVKHEVISTNENLLELYNKYLPDRIILFRAGLIIKRQTFPKLLKIHNLHCASIPQYGGLASIYRALRDKKYDQKVCLHEVTDKIDQGKLLLQEPYQLKPKRGYKVCEDIAYRSGFNLLEKII